MSKSITSLNQQKDSLFILVKSLSKSEKRQFNLYVSRLGGNVDAKFFSLFKFLDKMKEVAVTDITEPKNLTDRFEHLVLEESDLTALQSKPKIIQKDYKYLIKNNSQSQSLIQMQQKEVESHPHSWWNENSNRKKALRKVFLENSSDSEDDIGNKLYVREKDENWLKDQTEIQVKTERFSKERDEIIRKNKRNG
jgi:hypothetical protein